MTRRDPLLDQRRQHVDHICRVGADRRALFQEIVRAFGARIERRTRNREHFAPLLIGETRGDERTRTTRRLDHDRPEREPRHDAIAAREIAAARLPSHGHFRNHRAPFDDLFEQRRMFGRIDAIESPGQHRDRAGRKRRAMGARIDAAREA